MYVFETPFKYDIFEYRQLKWKVLGTSTTLWWDVRTRLETEQVDFTVCKRFPRLDVTS